MNYILFQLVVLHAALISGLGPGGRGRGSGGGPKAADRKPGFGGKGAGFSGDGGPPSDLFPSCAVSFLQFPLEHLNTDDI